MLYWFLLQSKVISYMYIYPLFWISFPFRPPQRTEQSSLCCTVDSHLFSSLYIVSIVCICQSQSSRLSHPSFPHLGPYICSLCLCFYFCFANRFICTISLDFTYMCYCTIFVLLTYLTLYNSLQDHPYLCKQHFYKKYLYYLKSTPLLKYLNSRIQRITNKS